MRTNSLYERLTTAQLDEFMPFMKGLKEGNRAEKGLELCEKWGIKTSRTAVHECFKRGYFSWALERAAWAANLTKNMPEFQEESRKLTVQKLFETLVDTDCDPKILIMIRSLQLEQDKIAQRERLALNRGKLETDKLKLAERKVVLLEAKITSARDALTKAKTKGGLTPEVLKQIEEKLGL